MCFVVVVGGGVCGGGGGVCVCACVRACVRVFPREERFLSCFYCRVNRSTAITSEPFTGQSQWLHSLSGLAQRPPAGRQ